MFGKKATSSHKTGCLLEDSGAQLLHSLDGTKNHPFVTPGRYILILMTSEFSKTLLRICRSESEDSYEARRCVSCA